MLGSRAVLLAAAVLGGGVAAGGCSLVSLDGLSGGLGPSDGSAGGADADGGTLTGYAGVVLADAPLAYWRLDETSGTTAADSSGHGNDATYWGGFMLGAPGALAGDGDTAVTLDGVSGFVTAGNRFAFAGQTPFSLEAWVSAQSQSTYAGVATCNDAVGGPPSEGYLLFVSPTDGPLGFQRLDGSNVSTAVSAAGPAVQEFTHVVAAFDGLELTVYANGEPQGTQTAAFSIAGAGAAFVLGAEAGGAGNYFAGSLDEVAVYDHALSADRVRAHYLAGIASPRRSPGAAFRGIARAPPCTSSSPAGPVTSARSSCRCSSSRATASRFSIASISATRWGGRRRASARSSASCGGTCGHSTAPSSRASRRWSTCRASRTTRRASSSRSSRAA